PGAPPIAVIGYGVWRDRLNADPDVVGRSLTVAGTEHTIVGVLPEAFAFGLDHWIWTPLRLSAAEFPFGDAPAVDIVARLAPSARIEDASAQAAAIQQSLASSEATTHANLRVRVLPWAMTVGLDSPGDALVIYFFQLVLSLILVVIGINVAILVYART